MPRVFVSYSWDSDDHKKRVADLVRQLRDDDLEVVFDGDCGPGGPSETIPEWCREQINRADRVLLVCTSSYRRYFEAKPREAGDADPAAPAPGLGVAWEARHIRRELFKGGIWNEKYRAVLFDARDWQHVPEDLEDYTRFELPRDYPKLRQWLKGSGAAPTARAREISWPRPNDYSWDLAGRKRERGIIRRVLSGDLVERILLFKGQSECDSGIGWLLDETCAYARSLQLAESRVDFRGIFLDGVLDAIQSDCDSVLPGSARDVARTPEFQLLAALQRLEEPLLLVFGPYEAATQSAREWIEYQLLSRLQKAPAVVVLIGGRETPRPAMYTWQGLARSFELEAIDQQDWVKFIQRKDPGLEQDEVAKWVAEAKGNVMATKWLLDEAVRRRREGTAARA